MCRKWGRARDLLHLSIYFHGYRRLVAILDMAGKRMPMSSWGNEVLAPPLSNCRWGQEDRFESPVPLQGFGWSLRITRVCSVVYIWPANLKIVCMCDEFRFAIDLMQTICLDAAGGEKAVDVSIQETSLIYRIFGGCLQSQVCTRTALAACTCVLTVCVCVYWSCDWWWWVKLL